MLGSDGEVLPSIHLYWWCAYCSYAWVAIHAHMCMYLPQGSLALNHMCMHNYIHSRVLEPWELWVL